MPLDIGVGNGKSCVPDPAEPLLQLDDNGYYWFLVPLLGELHVQTSQYVDLYGDARFTGQRLEALERMLQKARALVRAQPRTWKVAEGAAVVERARFEQLLDRWDAVVARAKELNRPVVCFGD
jgi:hypothetical protein